MFCFHNSVFCFLKLNSVCLFYFELCVIFLSTKCNALLLCINDIRVHVHEEINDSRTLIFSVHISPCSSILNKCSCVWFVCLLFFYTV